MYGALGLLKVKTLKLIYLHRMLHDIVVDHLWHSAQLGIPLLVCLHNKITHIYEVFLHTQQSFVGDTTSSHQNR